MAYLEELLPEFRKGAKIRKKSWDKRDYSYYKDGRIYDRNNQAMYSFSAKALSYDGWEFYKEPEPNWQYIIENKCLCWFWDDENETPKIASALSGIDDTVSHKFIKISDGLSFGYKFCRPVRRDEVNFYEDKK